MNLVYIKFNNRDDQVHGFYELATKARVTSLRDGLYGVPLTALALLDAQHLSYRRATDEEIAQAHAQIRTPVAPVLQ
ncbi:MAG: hypothetical protein HY710_08390 [Candidatus Latescibacteria bacterium]|nr:hypothetical protein [Candidatus Latescibacterota bacterium]